MIEHTDLERLYALYQRLPEFPAAEPLDSLRRRLGERYLALVYSDGGEDLGYKLGYALDEREFYSWLGGVMPQVRGRGVAQALLEEQEAWALAQGFKVIRVKSRNCFPAMLRLLIRNGYAIDGVTPQEDAQWTKIHFVKELAA